MLPFLDNVGDVPENPGFCIPKPSFGLGFFKLDRSGERVTDEPIVEPFEEAVVIVVSTEARLPFAAAVARCAYGLPLASVIDIPAPKRFN